MSHIAAPGNEASDRDVLIKLVPMETRAAQGELLALSRARVEEAREPGEGDAERASIFEIDPHLIVVEANRGGFRRSGHAKPFLSRRLALQ